MKDYNSFVRFFDMILIYEKGFGVKLNKFKTEVMWFGVWRDYFDTFFGLIWVRKMKFLGVFLVLC